MGRSMTGHDWQPSDQTRADFGLVDMTFRMNCTNHSNIYPSQKFQTQLSYFGWREHLDIDIFMSLRILRTIHGALDVDRWEFGYRRTTFCDAPSFQLLYHTFTEDIKCFLIAVFEFIVASQASSQASPSTITHLFLTPHKALHLIVQHSNHLNSINHYLIHQIIIQTSSNMKYSHLAMTLFVVAVANALPVSTHATLSSVSGFPLKKDRAAAETPQASPRAAGMYHVSYFANPPSVSVQLLTTPKQLHRQPQQQHQTTVSQKQEISLELWHKDLVMIPWLDRLLELLLPGWRRVGARIRPRDPVPFLLLPLGRGAGRGYCHIEWKGGRKGIGLVWDEEACGCNSRVAKCDRDNNRKGEQNRSF